VASQPRWRAYRGIGGQRRPGLLAGDVPAGGGVYHGWIQQPGAQTNIRPCLGGAQGREKGTSADKEVRGGRGSPETPKLAVGSGGVVWSN
jgi:hypothetical protein